VTAQSSSRDVRGYLVPVLLLLFVLPAGCLLAEAITGRDASELPLIIGKWLVFWGVGVRLFLAGVRQIFQPEFTARKIFELAEPGALAVVRELGFANVTMGTLGLASLANGAWLTPAAIVGALYYGLAGAGHLVRPERNKIEEIALVTDLLFFALLAFFLASQSIS
jgi:hypothetical protein